jgi:Zn finger protein HypA/HybF involved in hydrogenase expression
MKWIEEQCQKCGAEFSIPKMNVGEELIKCPHCNSAVTGVRTAEANFLSLSFNKKKKNKKGGGYVNGGYLKARR